MFRVRFNTLICFKSRKFHSKFELENLKDWRDIVDLIPENYREDSQKKRTGLSGIFAACLELTRVGIINIKQKKTFDDILIKKN